MVRFFVQSRAHRVPKIWNPHPFSKHVSSKVFDPIGSNFDTQIYRPIDTLPNSDFSIWTNPITTPVSSVQTFAQTKFGSLKTKHTERKNSILPDDFSACIKQKLQ